MAAEEGDGEGRAGGGQRAEEAPVGPGPARPLHPAQLLPLAQVRPRRRPRRVPETEPSLPMHQGSLFFFLLFLFLNF